jgi:hypothetical protein
MKSLLTGAVHDRQVVSPLNPKKKKKRHRRFRWVADLVWEEILEGIGSETWVDWDDRLEKLEIEGEIRIGIGKRIVSVIEKRIVSAMVEQIVSVIEKQTVSLREISEIGVKLEPSLDVRAARAIPDHPNQKMKKSLKVFWSACA